MKTPVITIDLGNTNPHFCFFWQDQELNPEPINQLSKIDFPEHTKVIVSNVGKTKPEVLEQFEFIDLPTLSSFKFMDMPVNYTASLGEDRLVQAYYLYHQMPEQKATLIDVGTFMTVDTVSRDQGFEGGFIYPGPDTFLKCYQRGARLPLLGVDQVNWDSPISLAHNTYEAISEATKSYFQGVLAQIKTDTVYLTGGGAPLLMNFLQSYTLCHRPQLIHQSLYELSKRLSN